MKTLCGSMLMIALLVCGTPESTAPFWPRNCDACIHCSSVICCSSSSANVATLLLPGLKMALQVTQKCKKLLARGWKKGDGGGIKDVQEMHVCILRVKKKEKDEAAGGQHCGCSTVRV